MSRAALAAALAGFLLSGCVATQKDVLDLSEQSDQLKSQVEDLKKTIGSMQANQADLSVQIKQLREELSAYSETVKASMGDMGKLSAKLDELGSGLSGKVSQLGQAVSQAQQKNLEALEAQKKEGGATDAFVTAEKRLESGDFAEAAQAFEDYLRKWPDGQLADVATYDLGLAYFGLKQWEKAGRQFAIVLDKYPKSGRTPAARLHYARCLLRLKKSRSEARAYLESIAADFPRAPEAKEASAELKRLK